MSSKPGCRLILIPTALELQYARELSDLPSERVVVELCGFGLIAAAARTSWLVAQLQPAQVLLLGIAGTMNHDIEIGMAYQFAEVACYGIGVGSGVQFQSVAELGWQHCPGDPSIGDPSIGDTIELFTTPGIGDAKPGQLLSVCAASNSDEDRLLRKQRFPQAMAEDMEGFGVALACRLTATPLHIVRGISNITGVRDKQTWRIADAMHSATRLAVRVLEL